MLNVLVEVLETLAIVILLGAEILPDSNIMLLAILTIRGAILLIRVYTFIGADHLAEND